MPSPLHIAAHNGAPEWGGAEIALVRVLLGLRERGHQVSLRVAHDVVAEGAREMGLESERLRIGGDVALHHTLRVKAELQRLRPDVLIVGTFRKTLHLAMGARLAGVPVVSRIGMATDVPRNAKYHLLFRRFVGRIAVNTGEIRADYLRALPGFDPERVAVVGKGIDLPSIRSEADAVALRASVGIPEDAFVVGALARFASEKRFDRWLDAFARLPEDAWALIVGDGSERESMEARIAELGIGERVCMVGRQPEPAPWLNAMDLLLVTSDTEALANVMLEAMAAGTAVVTTPVYGSADALQGEEEGVPPGVILSDFETETVAAALLDLHDRRREVYDMGRAARARAERAFTRDAELDAWESVLYGAVMDAL